MSSGEVSSRTNTTGPSSARFTASSGKKAMRPVAAPGPAASPLAITFAFLFSSGSKMGWRSWYTCSAGSILRMASSFVINPSLTISTAILTAAKPVRFPVRV